MGHRTDHAGRLWGVWMMETAGGKAFYEMEKIYS